MKINKLFIVSIALLLTLAGCKNNKGSESESLSTDSSSEPVSEAIDYKDERDYAYQNRLEMPSNMIHNIDDFQAIVDYHAFYKDVESFDVDIAFDYAYSQSRKTAYNEGCYLYWYAELVNGMMGIAVNEKDPRTWTISFEIYQNNIIDGHPTAQMLKDLTYKEPTSTRGEDYNNFATEDINKPVLDVATTQQLWYAAEHGYRINPIENSPAEKYYNKAKTLLRNIVDDDMTEYEKVDVIYNYIEHHSSYCFEALNGLDSDDPVNYPDRECAKHKAFTIEGFFDNQTIVCDGFSKVYTLLGRMEGLNIVRGTGTSDEGWTTKEVAGHAYCYVEVDGQYYLSCPTWGQQRITATKFIVSQTYFMAPRSKMDSQYPCLFWDELTFATTDNSKKEYQARELVIDQSTSYSAYLSNDIDYNPIINYFVSLSERDVFTEFYFDSYSTANTFKNACTNKAVTAFLTSNNTVVVIK